MNKKQLMRFPGVFSLDSGFFFTFFICKGIINCYMGIHLIWGISASVKASVRNPKMRPSLSSACLVSFGSGLHSFQCFFVLLR